MGEALLAGLLASGWSEPGELAVVEVDPDRRSELAERFPEVAVQAEPVRCDGAVLAVKPPDAPAVAATVAAAGVGRLLSIAAGVPTSRIEDSLGVELPVVRAMPNTPARIGMGAAAIAPGAHATRADLDWAESILTAVGRVVRVEEADLDAVTGLSGSGPAYVFLVAEALIDAGIEVGLTADVARDLVLATIEGAGALLAAGPEDPTELRRAVTSPGGTTEAGIAVLEEWGIRGALRDAVVAATDRSVQLGQG